MSSTQLPSTMRALWHDQKADTLKLENSPLPVPGPDEYLVKVIACGLTRGELKWPRPPEFKLSHPGVEMAGEVVKAPPNAKFKPGDKVYLRTQYPRPASARDYSINLESEMALMPKNISAEEAASVPVSALTAWQGLYEIAGLPEPSAKQSSGRQIRVLVNGTSGGSGLWMLQLAKASGFYVIGVCGPSNVDFVKSLGADEVLDYSKTSLADWIAANKQESRDSDDWKVDLALDCVGRLSDCEQCWHTVRDGGMFVTIALVPDDLTKWPLPTPEGVSPKVKGTFFIMHPSSEQLDKISALIEKGVCSPVVDSVWKLEDYQKAFERSESGRARGKVVLRIAPEK